jgi:hypothetical protein
MACEVGVSLLCFHPVTQRLNRKVEITAAVGAIRPMMSLNICTRMLRHMYAII